MWVSGEGQWSETVLQLCVLSLVPGLVGGAGQDKKASFSGEGGGTKVAAAAALDSDGVL